MLKVQGTKNLASNVYQDISVKTELLSLVPRGRFLKQLNRNALGVVLALTR